MKVHKVLIARAYDHRLGISYECPDFNEVACNRRLGSSGLTTDDWPDVTCNQCLKNRPEAKKK